MTSFFEAWRRHLWLWLPPLVFCALNLLVFAFYRSAFAGKVEGLEQRYRTAIDQVEALAQERRIIQEYLDKVESHQTEVNGLYSTHFETEARRFTRVIQEVKNLARQAGLQPLSLSYPKKVFAEQGLVQRNINFGVEGSYDELRTFINFLELSEHFITLNSVTLGDIGKQGNPNLNIKLVLSTIFAIREIATAEVAETPGETAGLAATDGLAETTVPEESTI